ncbi:hypothetical protein [Serratia marcescens]|uniref:hypothetical protein n=1 Tax=Serratia marcescens TaxID=615 RepID=UPI0007454C18|nr:hypothetical protein [Serratia marcescens]CUY60097.1 Uncharacterised protein [Serratia marcescens]CUY63030.1 Uncharacterised protein [Serratia marcescens]CUY98646.1 Uncharacterised protein [Serratia marcescens]CUZ42366.1 Uncharacterised protein [Serratia marcescens]CVD39771.1 Uncharacterised protein [Serratia marcescens]
MLKTPVATAIAALNPQHNHIQDFHVLAHLNRVRAFAWGGRRCGKTYAARQQELIRAAFKLSAGATLRLLHTRRNPQKGRIFSYDLAGGEDKSVECVFKRNYATGGLTLVSVNILSRKWQNSPWFYLDEWPWA